MRHKVKQLPNILINLAIDIGNSRTKAGVFANGQLLSFWVGEPAREQEIFELATNHGVQNVILSTVGKDLSADMEQKFSDLFRFIRLDATTPLPFENRYKTPHTLGKDRLAAVAGAQALFPGQACLVVDAGTCITLDVLSATGAYLGGNIAPGIPMRLRAMHEFTQRLPLVDMGPLTGLLGDSTHTALRNGAQLGAALEIEAMAQRLCTEMNEIIIVLTGGDAVRLAESLKNEIFVQPNLVLIGLNKILSHHVEQNI